MTKAKSRFLINKNCPFCGHRFVDLFQDDDESWLACIWCKCSGPTAKNFKHSISKWNRRMINRIAGIDFGSSEGQEHLKPFCLRACPFCGEAGEGLEIMGEDATEVFWCACNVCGTDGPFAPEKKIAVRMWNRRIRVAREMEN